jgi:hypothetical protein
MLLRGALMCGEGNKHGNRTQRINNGEQTNQEFRVFSDFKHTLGLRKFAFKSRLYLEIAIRFEGVIPIKIHTGLAARVDSPKKSKKKSDPKVAFSIH